VADGGRTVLQTSRAPGICWPTAQAALQLYAEQALPDEPEPTATIGIDETRRGKPVWRQDAGTGTWELVADARHIGVVNAVGGRGLFGQVEGRTADFVAAWLSPQPEHWKQQVKHVAIDLRTTLRAAVHRALSHATDWLSLN
jgi:hypothetical protein